MLVEQASVVLACFGIAHYQDSDPVLACLGYTYVQPVEGGPPDDVQPIVTNVTPAEGTPIGRGDPVFFDVTDETGLKRVIIAAKLGADAYEVVHDGDAFAPRYANLSTRVEITGGFRYRVRRAGGWPSAPSIVPFAFDTSANEPA